MLLQVARLRLCEKLLIAMELAAYLNDTSLLLQAVVQCYGLLAPLLHFKLPAVPVVQVREHILPLLLLLPHFQLLCNQINPLFWSYTMFC